MITCSVIFCLIAVKQIAKKTYALEDILIQSMIHITRLQEDNEL